MHADARQADFCMYLSADPLGGLLLNAVANLWWADPVSGPHHGSYYWERGCGRVEGQDLLRLISQIGPEIPSIDPRTRCSCVLLTVISETSPSGSPK